MKIALVNAKNEMPKLKYTKKVQRQYSDRGQVFPNMSLAYVAGYVESLGHTVRTVDSNALHLSVEETVGFLREWEPDVIGYNLLTEPFLDTLEWIETIKSAVPVPTVVGGFHLKLYPRETLAHRYIDYAVIGPGWKTFEELLEALENGERDLSSIRGLGYRENGEVVINPPREDTMGLDDVPFPARHMLPNDRYTTILTKAWPITVILSAVGCPFNCLYCDMTGCYRPRDAVRVVDEVEECVRRFGIREIFFQDETFTVDKKRVFRICEEIGRRGLKFDFAIRTRADCVTREMLMALKDAGCCRVNFGVESADPDVARNIKRSIPLEQIRSAVAWAKEAKLLTLGFYLLGSPGETVESIRRTINLAVELDTDYVSISKLVPVPNSRLYELVMEETGIDYWREFTLGNRDIINRIAYYKSEVQGEELDRWLGRAYRAFYFRPSYVWRVLKRVRSPREFFNLLTSAWSLL